MSNEIKPDNAVSIWGFITRNKFVFFTLYYLTILFYSLYVKDGEYYYFDLVKKYLVKYNNLAFFIIIFSIPVVVFLRNVADYMVRTNHDHRNNGAAVSTLVTAKRLEEVILTLLLIFIPVVLYNTTFKGFWFYAFLICALEFLIHKFNLWLFDKHDIYIDLNGERY